MDSCEGSRISGDIWYEGNAKLMALMLFRRNTSETSHDKSEQYKVLIFGVRGPGEEDVSYRGKGGNYNSALALNLDKQESSLVMELPDKRQEAPGKTTTERSPKTVRTSGRFICIRPSSLGTFGRIKLLLEIHAETGDIRSLADAISVAEELLGVDDGVEPLMEVMMRMRLMRINGTDGDEEMPVTRSPGTSYKGTFDAEPPSINFTIILAEPSFYDTAVRFFNQYSADGNINDLQDVLKLTKNTAVEHKNLKPLLDDILGFLGVDNNFMKPTNGHNHSPENDTLCNTTVHLAESTSHLGLCNRYLQDKALGLGHDNSMRALYDCFKVSGEMHSLENAIEIGMSFMSSEINMHVRARLSSLLSELVWNRGESLESSDDQDLAIQLAEEAVKILCSCKALPPREAYHRLMNMLKTRHVKRGNLEDLDRAIHWAEKERDTTPENTVERADSACNVYRLLHTRYQIRRDIQDLELLIKRSEEAAAGTPLVPGESVKAGRIDAHARFLAERFQRLGETEDIERSVKLGEDLLNMVPPGHPNRAVALNNQRDRLETRFRRTGNIKDLIDSMEICKEALAATSDSDPERHGAYLNLAASQFLRFERFGKLEDLEEAVSWAQKANDAIPPSATSSDKAQCMNALGVMLFARYETLKNPEDLERAIELNNEAVDLTPLNDKDARVDRLNSLCIKLTQRYKTTTNITDLTHAIERSTEAVIATDPSSSNRPEVCNNLAAQYKLRYERYGSEKDIDQAIVWMEEALAAAPPGHHLHPLIALGMGVFTKIKFYSSGDPNDLQKALDVTEGVAKSISSNDPTRVRAWKQMSSLLKDKYFFSKDESHLEQAMRWGMLAVETTPPASIIWEDVVINIAELCAMRYQRFGDEIDFNLAIKWFKEALEATPVEGIMRRELFNEIARIFYTRYFLTKAAADIEESIAWSERAVNETPADNPSRTTYLTDLSRWLWARAQRHKSEEDLTRAIVCVEEALRISRCSDPENPRIVAMLSGYLQTRYEWLGNLEDLEKGIQYASSAVSGSLDFSSGIVSATSLHLSSLLEARYIRFKDPEDLEQAIKYSGNVAAATRINDPNRASVLIAHGSPIAARFHKTNSDKDFYWVLHILYDAWSSHSSRPNNRVIAARNAGRLLAIRKKWQEASSIFSDAVKALPKISYRSFARGDQEYLLSDFAHISGEAVAVALQAGEEASHCLRLLELGRGVIFGHVIDRREELSELRNQHPDLFEKYHRIRTEVDIPLQNEYKDRENRPRDLTLINQEIGRRRDQAVNELEDVIGMIRELSGFEGFQLPPHSAKLRAMADKGPIVIINSTSLRNDALIVTTSDIQSLHLPKMTFEAVKEKMNLLPHLTQGLRKTFHSRNKQLEEILLWLWEVAVEPILKALNIEPPLAKIPHSKLPHIWWIGVGLLANAPFHAAGNHRKGSTKNTFSHVISSYIPTIKALSYARQRPLELLSKPDSRLLLVSMPETPGYQPLYVAKEEIESITAATNGKVDVTYLEHPSANQILQSLPSAHAVHFSCHGVSNPINPSGSHLLLRDDKGLLDKLSVETISKTNLKNAQIAYLSACSTAENTSEKIPDESIYIASAFQLAGFSHVLATQWVANDDICREVSEEFYRTLFSEKKTKASRRMNDGGHLAVSTAFHGAVQKVRKQNLREPLYWASFIHTGA